MKVKGILFDCDGVLLDSEAIYLNALTKYLATIGIYASVNDVVSVLGKPMNLIVEELRQKYGLDNYTDDELISEQRKIFRDHFDHIDLEPMPYLVDFLRECKAQGIKTAIVSSSELPYLENIVDRLHIRSYFDEIISGQMVEHGKPAPDIYLYAAEKIGLSKEQLVVIEDSKNGIQAGKNAGIYTIGYKGSTIRQDTHDADIEVDNFQQIQWLLK